MARQLAAPAAAPRRHRRLSDGVLDERVLVSGIIAPFVFLQFVQSSRAGRIPNMAVGLWVFVGTLSQAPPASALAWRYGYTVGTSQECDHREFSLGTYGADSGRLPGHRRFFVAVDNFRMPRSRLARMLR